MKCYNCGMVVKSNPIREDVFGKIYYYCCRDCFEEELCKRDKPLRKALAKSKYPTTSRRGGSSRSNQT